MLVYKNNLRNNRKMSIKDLTGKNYLIKLFTKEIKKDEQYKVIKKEKPEII